ncbi:hypothetical protein Taro_037523 [Colocasia esculenta]|uniref:Uncharacterized protein n=1 Tax=Colocasia esculenta TaxID=4460 RepID=A0A843W5W2_COLES|nr:hypothetical protein [Colocasia esculenta]
MCCVDCVFGLVCLCALGAVLCSVDIFARAKQMLVFRSYSLLVLVEVRFSPELCCARFWLLQRCPLVEVHRLAAVVWWCFPELFVVILVRVPLPLGLLLCSLKSSTILPPWFEVSVVWLIAIALPSRLRCIAWLLCVLVQFPRTVGCCPGEICSQDYFGLVSADCCATSGLRYAAIVFGLRSGDVFPERLLAL